MIIFALAAVLLAPLQLRSQPIEVQLVERRISESDLADMPYTGYGMLDKIPGSLRFAGGAKVKVQRWTGIYVGGKSSDAAAQIDASGSRFSKIWVDINQNGILEDSEMAQYTGKDESGSSNIYCFSKPPQGKYGPVHFQLKSPSPDGILVRPTSCLEGQINLNGATKKVRVTDRNLDGRYGSGSMDHADLAIIGDGREEPSWQFGFIQDSTYFGLFKVEIKDQRTLEIRKLEGPTGRLVSGKDKPNPLLLSSALGYFYSDLVNSSGYLPAGEWTIIRGSFRRLSNSGNVQYYSLTSYRGKKLMIRPNVDTKLDELGSGLKVALSADVSSRVATFSIRIADRFGNQFEPLGTQTSDGFMVNQRPKLTLIDPMNRPLPQIQMTYGATTWPIPAKAAHGVYRAVVVWATGVFGDLKAETKVKL